MPGGDRGRRSAPQFAATRAVRTRQKRCGAALLRRYRARSGAAGRQPRCAPPGWRSSRTRAPCSFRCSAATAAASRNELRKLALYARGRAEIDVDDIAAVVSDASTLALDELVDTAFAGRPADLEAQLAKVRAAGSPVGSIFFAAQRQLAQLHKWRTAIEGGAPFSIDNVQPPLHFRRKGAVEAALKQWSAARLTAAMAELADAVLASRRMSALADTIAERALLSIAVKARRSAA